MKNTAAKRASAKKKSKASVSSEPIEKILAMVKSGAFGKGKSKLPEMAPLPWTASEKANADFYLNDEHGGTQHLSWMIDRYWLGVAQRTLIPGFALLYDKLVELEHSEFNKMSWGDADGEFYYIPNKDGRKVMVYTSQNRDFLITMMPKKDYRYEEGMKTGPIVVDTHSFHIRRIWRLYEDGDIHDLKATMKDIHSVLAAVDHLSDYADDHYQYPHRPSIELYRKIDFNLDDYQENPRFYGDLRDPGFVFSSRGRSHDRVEGTVYSFGDLNYFPMYLGHLADELNVNINHLFPKGNDR